VARRPTPRKPPTGVCRWGHLVSGDGGQTTPGEPRVGGGGSKRSVKEKRAMATQTVGRTVGEGPPTGRPA